MKKEVVTELYKTRRSLEDLRDTFLRTPGVAHGDENEKGMIFGFDQCIGLINFKLEKAPKRAKELMALADLERKTK